VFLCCYGIIFMNQLESDKVVDGTKPD
jgi:hypothetical protein